MSHLRTYRKRLALACLLLAIGPVCLTDEGRPDKLLLGAFSALLPGGGFDGAWRVTELPSVKAASFSLVEISGVAVVRVDAAAAAGSLTRRLDWAVSSYPILDWRWRVDRVIGPADITTKEGDDFSARLYVMFDFPLDRLSLVDRTKLRLARWIYGDAVPAAALCYVWTNREAVGTEAWSAYTDRVRVIVLRNRDDALGDWAVERRDVAEDFRRAFGGEVPRSIGIAIAADTDQTGESVTAWFGDIVARPVVQKPAGGGQAAP